MRHALDPDLLMRKARADFLAECELIEFSLKLPEAKRQLYDMGLYTPSFEEFERLMGHRHRDDDREDHPVRKTTLEDLEVRYRFIVEDPQPRP